MRFASILCVFTAGLWAQDALVISGDVSKTLTVTASDLAGAPRAEIQLGENTYQGVWLDYFLERAGVPADNALRGKALTTYLLAEARDGYQVLYSLAEIDPQFVDNRLLLVDRVNGTPLQPEQGPFRLLTALDKAAARFVRGVVRIRVVQVVKD